MLTLLIPMWMNLISLTRDINDVKMKRFSDKLSDIDWTDTVNSADVNDSFKSFFRVFVKLYDECFLPLAVTRTKQLTARKPWITQVILTSIKKKNRFYRDY